MQPVVGDPSLNGWGSFLVYVLTAGLCAANAYRSIGMIEHRARHVARAQARRRFWSALALLLMILGLTRVLDLQALTANIVRGLLSSEGLYGERSGLQLDLIIAVGAFSMIGLLTALVSFRRVEPSILFAMAGAAALVIFTVIRTISLHAIDSVLNQGPPHLQVNNVVEIGLLAWIGFAALAFARNLNDEGESARLRALSLQERRRQLSERRRLSQS